MQTTWSAEEIEEYQASLRKARDELRSEIKQVRSYNGRARQAVRELPTLLREKAWRLDRTDAEEQDIRDCLNEAIGALVGIADTLKIEL